MASSKMNITIRHRPDAPVEGSQNPFDDFDIVDAPEELRDANRFIFEPSCSPPESPEKPVSTKKMARRPRSNSFGMPEDDDDDDDGDMSDRTSSGGESPVSAAQDPISLLNEPVIPFHESDAVLYQFVQTPLEESCGMRMTILVNPASKTFTCIHSATQRIVLTAQRRTDGLKALASSANYSILLAPTDHCISQEPVKICKLRSNAACSQYSLYDTGKNPSKAAGMLEVRRELMGVRLDVISGVYTKRATYCVLPLPNHVKRPVKKEETLVERWKRCDSGLVGFSPFLASSNHDRLPSFEHFGGFAATHSIKNTMLHDVKTKQTVFRLGRQTQDAFNMEFAHPFSLVSAFALAVAICDSKVHPKHQM